MNVSDRLVSLNLDVIGIQQMTDTVSDLPREQP
jgi:hypothetical protein